MAGLPEETLEQRATRLERVAELLRAVAEDAIAENQRAYDRATEAIMRAENAEHEASTAFFAWQRSLRKGNGEL